mmetsp:Transcript_76184/g.144987  ORF Transcript_76184/g.144987 Transcript_76184/m.144987 type:complete len:80 (-) Transcript_76184:15-254(-)
MVLQLLPPVQQNVEDGTGFVATRPLHCADLHSKIWQAVWWTQCESVARMTLRLTPNAALNASNMTSVITGFVRRGTAVG